MAKTEKMITDLAVVGGGPGGYVAAIRAAQLGFDVTLVEKAELGGICLNWGCIPTKALLRSAEVYRTMLNAGEYGLAAGDVSFDFAAVVARSRKIAGKLSQGVAFLLKKNKVRVLAGHARLAGGPTLGVELNDGTSVVVEANNVILATGARTRDFPGMRIDGKRILGSRAAMTLDRVPSSMAIIGAGSIGVEFADVFHSFGSQVTLFEMLPAVLPASDADVSRELAKSLKKRRIGVNVGTRVVEVEKLEGGIRIIYERKGKEKALETECLLMAVGVTPISEDLGLEAAGVETVDGWVKVDGNCRTTASGVFAIGDLTGQPCLAHVASAEGIVAVEHIAGHWGSPIDYNNIPACTYCSPQVASLGLTESAAVEAGHTVKSGKFPFVANGKALAMGETAGFVKTVVDGHSGKLLGLHIIGPEATEMLMEFAVGRKLGATAKDILGVIHPHPTLSESIHEAVAAALGEAIHL